MPTPTDIKATTARGRRPGPPLAPRDRTQLRMMTQAIREAEVLIDRRARLMSRLWDQGHSLDSMAEAAGLTREAVRRSVLRWRERTTAKP